MGFANSAPFGVGSVDVTTVGIVRERESERERERERQRARALAFESE